MLLHNTEASKEVEKENVIDNKLLRNERIFQLYPSPATPNVIY